MNKKLVMAGILSAFAITACVSTMKSNRNVASISLADKQTARAFNDADIEQLASTDKLNIKSARLITDNDVAFETKLAMIKRAQKSIRMSYFIYGDDDSSAEISKALIEKAKSGVQVKLLVDFITNAKRLDHFQMMVDQGNRNLMVHFYNFPSDKIFNDAKYMTLPCPQGNSAPTADECFKFKQPMMAALAQRESTPFSRMLLAGLYGKSATALKIAAGYGAGIDAAKYKAMIKEIDESETKVIFDFFKHMKEALGGDLFAKIKLSNALASNGATLNPVLNELTGRLPVKPLQPNIPLNADEWDHISDYTHHKLIAIDGTTFQLGGRNVEDSYHMKNRLGDKGKYIFMDTDFYAETYPAQGSPFGGASGIEASFDSTFDYPAMVVDISKVQAKIPFDMAYNPNGLMEATGYCLGEAKTGKVQMSQLGECIESALPQMPHFVSAQKRKAAAAAEMEASYNRYVSKYKRTHKDNFRNQPYVDGSDSLTAADAQNAKVYYLENLTFDRKNLANQKRRIGAHVGQEAADNKSIHAAWFRGLENACVASAKSGQETRVILHSAYLFMPAGMLLRMAQMMNGDFGDCSKVRITLLTNSIETTDLNAINVFARYQMSQLFKFHAQMAAKRKVPKLEYFEYNAASVGTGISLHTKLSVLGDDIIIGSANADVRSYYMDTNNGVLIRGATDLNRDYVAFVDNIINNSTRAKNETAHYEQVTEQEMAQMNVYILAALLKRWDKKGTVTPERQKKILDEVTDIGAQVTKDTKDFLNFRSQFERAGYDDQADQLNEDMLKRMNNFDKMFKVL